ncbi:MAG: hypothetical protein Q8N26_10300 [Myxococcales bacterium]|nr:hypothetical protein [Myxococcales bacterium]
MPLYLRLFHGRADPSDVLTDWGTDGPTIGPFESFHATYCESLTLWNDETCFELDTDRSLVHFDGVYYGDLDITEAPLSTPVLSLEDAERTAKAHARVPSHHASVAPLVDVFLDAIRANHGDELARRLALTLKAALR